LADLFISSKGNSAGDNMSDLSSLHVGSSSTSADTLEVRITTSATLMSRLKAITFLENVIRVLIQGSLHSTKFSIT
jgi:hypothetical protein